MATIEYYDGYSAYLDYFISGEIKPPQNFYKKIYLGKYSGQDSYFNFILYPYFIYVNMIDCVFKLFNFHIKLFLLIFL